ncbi:MAG TPA: glycosyltransferase family 87 protein [Candidatus Dormibacteraeota bacterium]|nr:glycosyltransferase family 87 protein [Candidatus Dormibacteraeota bacterium]
MAVGDAARSWFAALSTPVAGGGRLRSFIGRHAVALLVLGFAAVSAIGAVWIQSAVSEFSGPITPSGHHDFFAFYSAATLIHGGHAPALYDAGTLTALQRQLYPHPVGYAGYMPFINPPAAAALLSPLAAMPESTARLVWLLISVALAVACAMVLSAGRDIRIRGLAILVVLATFPAYQTFTEGQWSFVLLLGCLGALVAARRNQPLLAGIALSVLWLKPPLLVLVLVWLLLTRHWRVAAAMAGGVVAITVAALPWTGLESNLNYVRYLGDVVAAHAGGAGAAGQTAWEGALPNMEGLIGLAATLFGQQNALAVDAATALLAAILVGFYAWAMRTHWRDRPMRLGHVLAAVCLGLLLDPHLYAQDCALVIVLVALVLGRAQTEPMPRRRGDPGPDSIRAQAAILLAGAVLLDLSAIDTYWVQGLVFKPLHIFTFVLIAGVVIAAWPRRASAPAVRHPDLGLRTVIPEPR